MIKIIENRGCCDLPCIDSCPYKHETIAICDCCGREVELPLFRANSCDYCEDCFKDYIFSDFKSLILENDEALEALSTDKVGD